MKILIALALVSSLAGSVRASDLVVHKEKHTDAVSMGAQTQPPKDAPQVLWIGKDRMRFEDGQKVTIVRADLKKMFLLDMQAKTCSTVELPLDLKKYMPAASAAMAETMASRAKPAVAATGETQKIKDWNATRYTLTMTMPTLQTESVNATTGAVAISGASTGGTTRQEIWVTKDIGADRDWREMYTAMMSTNPLAMGAATEMKKIDGFPVLVETTRKLGPTEIKSREAVTAVEEKEPVAGFYDVPAGFTEKPFDPMAGIMPAGASSTSGR